MNRKIISVFCIIVIGLLGLVFFISNTFSVQKETERTEIVCMQLAEWERQTLTAEEDGETAVIYTIDLPEELRGRANLAIYSIHQNLQVSIDGEAVYTLQWIEGRNPFGKTPGIHWNFIGLTEADIGKTAVIKVTSAYPDCLEIVPEFYLGDKEAICKKIISEEIQYYFIGIAMILLGIILIAFWIYAYSGMKKGSNLLFLGTFSIVLAIWMLNELRSTVLLFYSPLISAYISFISLMLMPIPFLMYAKEFFHNSNAKSWYILCGVSVVQIVVCVILQVLDKKDFRETMISEHLMLVAVLILVFYYTIREIISFGFTRKMKLHLVGICACGTGAALDVTMYYTRQGKIGYMFCAISFLLYIAVLGMVAMKETYHILQQGKLAKKYEEMAYHDLMTGMYNRTAYEELINSADAKRMPYAIIMFDLNDLKKCNDVHGHNAGDDYIIRCAQIIEEVFGKMGSCYRIGGDEFCVIVPAEMAPYCEKALEKLEAKVREANKKEKEYEIHIAYGTAVFDAALDYELNDTRSRADANMYRMKFDMKNKRSI